MGRKKEEYEKEIVEVIKKNKITFISHIFGHYFDLKSAQFYNLELEKSEKIKEEIEKNRAKGCNFLRNKWIASENATLQIAAYRLICGDDERQMLNQQYIETKQTNTNVNIEISQEEKEKYLSEIKKGLDELNDY